jgi:hypothetical protein
MYAEKRFDVEVPPVKLKPTLTGFIAWLRTKPPHNRYDFDDCEGECVLGQYMTHCGIEWKIARTCLPTYAETVARVFGLGGGDQAVLANRPWTYGAALKRAERLCRR